MRISFNEISFQPFVSSKDLYDVVNKSLINYDQLVSDYNLSHIIAPEEVSSIKVTGEYDFMQWFKSLNTPQRNRVQLLFLRRPFSDQALGKKHEETNRYFFISEELGIEQEYCKGLATAHLLGIPSLSLSTHPYWESTQVQFWSYNDDMTTEVEIECLNFAANPITSNPTLLTYFEGIQKLELKISEIDPNEKQIVLRNDHGKDKLHAFSKKLIESDYVEAIVNSLPFNPHTSRFIRSAKPNGLIEIVLHWEDAGYGLVVQSTGSNQRETEEIAKLLRKKYDK